VEEEMMLKRKLARDLWRQRWQVLAVVAVTLLGTALFGACSLAYVDLRASYQATQTRTHLADMTLDVTALSAGQVRRVAELPGVVAGAGQLVLDWPIVLPHGRDADGHPARVQTAVRLISLRLGRQAPLDQVVVLSGHYPTAPQDVLVEQHFAAYHHLAPGATVEVAAPGGLLALRVTGIAVSAEYLWVARSRQDVMPSPAEFGVLFVPRPLLAKISRAGAADNRLLYSLAPGPLHGAFWRWCAPWSARGLWWRPRRGRTWSACNCSSWTWTGCASWPWSSLSSF
jgi:putative ABC transport system permease protein